MRVGRSTNVAPFISELSRRSQAAPASGVDQPETPLIQFGPVNTLNILYGLLLIGFAFSLTIVHCLYGLYSCWTQFRVLRLSCYDCLRAGLVFHVLLQTVQLPLRCVIFRQVACLRRNPFLGPTPLVDKIRDIEQTAAWRINQKLALFVYLNSLFLLLILLLGRFILDLHGDVKLLESYYAARYTSWTLLFFLSMRILVTLYWGCSYYTKIIRNKGANQEMLKKLVSSRWDEANTASSTSSCVICMSSFEKGEQLSTLPCSDKHIFHSVCVKQWLKKARSCPLCMRSIG